MNIPNTMPNTALEDLLGRNYSEYELNLVELGMSVARAVVELGPDVSLEAVKHRFMEPEDDGAARAYDPEFNRLSTAEQIRAFLDSRKEL